MFSNATCYPSMLSPQPPQIIEKLARNSESIDVLHLFRDMMVDIICATSFTYRIGALEDRAQGKGVNYLVRAVDDWPKRAIIVRAIEQQMNSSLLTTCPSAISYLRLFGRLFAIYQMTAGERSSILTAFWLR